MSNKKEMDELMFDIAVLLEKLKKWLGKEYPEKAEEPTGEDLLKSANEIVDEGAKHWIDKKGKRYNYDCIGTVLRCIYKAGYKFNEDRDGISDYFAALNKDIWPIDVKNHFYNMLGMWDLRSCGKEIDVDKVNYPRTEPESGDLLIWQKDHNGQATSHGHVIIYVGLDEDGFAIFLSGSTGGSPRLLKEVETDLTEVFFKYDKKYPHFTMIRPDLYKKKNK